jgi:hypothetical protein
VSPARGNQNQVPSRFTCMFLNKARCHLIHVDPEDGSSMLLTKAVTPTSVPHREDVLCQLPAAGHKTLFRFPLTLRCTSLHSPCIYRPFNRLFREGNNFHGRNHNVASCFSSVYSHISFQQFSPTDPGVGEIFNILPARHLGPTQSPVKWVPGLLPGSKVAGTWR